MATTKCDVTGCKRDYDIICVHCQATFCSKHYLAHIKLANNELVPLANELNSMIHTVQYSNPMHQAFQQLEQSREMNHRQIDKLYDEKKKQLQLEVEFKRELQLNKLQKLDYRVKKLISEGDASFRQIGDLKRSFRESQNQYKKFQKANLIRLHYEPEGLRTTISNKNLFFGDDIILSLEDQAKLNEFYGKQSQKWVLIYKATRDGFTGSAFHSYCDNQGPTMTVIQSKPGGYLFGGYTTVSWKSTGNYGEDPYGAFLFTLSNPHDIPPTKYPVIETDYAIYNKTECGPTFGCGHDLYVCDESHIKTGSYFYFPWSYNDRTGRGSETFTGDKFFQTSEIEVYRLVDN